MKKLAVLFLLITTVLLGITSFGIAKDNFSVNLRGIYSIYRDKDLYEDGKGIKGELSYKWAYFWGSWEKSEMRLTGQRAGSLDLIGVGLGGKAEITEFLNAFLEIGYYIPDSDLQKNTMKYAEGVGYKWKKTLSEIGLNNPTFNEFNLYKYELKPGIGGAVGLGLKQNIYKGLMLNITASYRFLNLKEDWDAYHSTIPNCCIQTKEKQDFSGGVLGIGLSYRF
jgi:opacity protein-like surface antigen